VSAHQWGQGSAGQSARLATVGLGQSVQTDTGLWPILQDIHLEIAQGEHVAITGRSGSGKSTLLGLLAGLDRATTGEVWLCGQPLHDLDEDARAAIRLAHVGFVFQSFQLLPHLTALENVMLPLTLGRGVRRAQADQQAREMLAQVGLAARINQTPRVLSGGEQQRVAIARALVHRPDVVFADEPTGNLDGQTAQAIEALLFGLNREHGTTLVLVTHDAALAGRCGRRVHLADGRLVQP
jgi:putative ABC transport system ATP-binding protein